jgi:mRNA-degrading endonuclease RelE of RelBE toxin-antitoxin system
MPEIYWAAEAERMLDSLSPRVREQIRQKVELLREFPYLGVALRGEWQGFRQLLIAKHRVVYQLLSERKDIVVAYIRPPGMK